MFSDFISKTVYLSWEIKNFESRREVTEAFSHIPIHKNTTMKIAFAVYLLMSCTVKNVSQMVQVWTDKV